MPVTIAADAVPELVRDRLRHRPGTRWVGIDGFGAAGKTTLARAVVAALSGASLVQVDDFGRAGLTGWDRRLFAKQVLEPVQRGQTGRYQTWDLEQDRPRGWAEVAPGGPIVVEGVSATDVRVPVPWDLTLWVDAPADLRSRRILDRDGPTRLARWQDDWLPSERDYAARQQPWRRVDVIVREQI